MELLKNPKVLGGIVLVLLGLLIYFFMPAYALPMLGLPMTTIVFMIVGLAAIYMGMKK